MQKFFTKTVCAALLVLCMLGLSTSQVVAQKSVTKRTTEQVGSAKSAGAVVLTQDQQAEQQKLEFEAVQAINDKQELKKLEAAGPIMGIKTQRSGQSLAKKPTGFRLPNGNMAYGFCTYYDGIADGEKNYISFDVDAPTSPTYNPTLPASLYAGEYVDNVVYAIEGTGTGGNGGFYAGAWENLTLVTSSVTSTNIMDMAYDYATTTMYAASGTELFTVNLSDGTLTSVAALSGLGGNLFTLACSLTGQLYCIDANGGFYSIDKTTAAATLVGSTGVATSYVQSMGFDHNTETLYWCNCNNSDGILYEIDPTTGVVTNIGLIGANSEVTGFHVPYIASTTIAEAPTNFVVTPNADFNLEAVLTWTNPTNNIGGEALSTITSIVVKRGSQVLDTLTTSVTPGAAGTFTDNTITTPGVYNYSIFAITPDGNGRPANASASIGCVTPIASECTGTTTTTATITINGGSAWNIEYGAAGFTPTEGTTVAATASPYTITGLTSTTSYEYYVQSACGENASEWIGPFAFATQCEAITLPYAQGFDDGEIPLCWSEIFENGSHSWTYVASASNPAGTQSGAGNANYTHATSGTITKLVSPMFDLSANTVATLSFWHTQKDWAGDQDILTVYYKNSAEGEWIQLAQYTESIEEWTGEMISLPNLTATYWIAFEGTDAYGYGIKLDNVEIFEQQLVTVAGVVNDAYGAPVGSAVVTYAGLISASDTTDATGNYSVELTNGLEYNISVVHPDFELYTETYTTNGDATKNFVITNCKAVSGLASTNVSDTVATLSWTVAGTEAAWDIEYGVKDFVLGEGTLVTATTNPYTLSGLTSGTAYDFYVRANCGDDGNSTWSEVASFTTAVACSESLTAVNATIGEGTTGSYALPVNTFYNYSYTQQLITNEEMFAQGAFAGTVNTISFEYIHATAQTKDNCVIYMGNTELTEFVAGGWVPVDEMTEVYAGTLEFEQGLCTITLQTPFNYDGQSSLVIAVVNNHGDYTTSSNPTFNVHATEGNLALRYQNDNNSVDLTTFAETGAVLAQRNNMVLGMCVTPPEMVTVSGTVTALTGAAPIEGVSVTFDGTLGGTQTTDATGAYSIDVVQGFNYNINVAKAGYNSLSEVFAAPETETATKNFQMTAPVLGVSPLAVAGECYFMGTDSASFVISNTGDGPLTWKAKIQYPEEGSKAEDSPAIIAVGGTDLSTFVLNDPANVTSTGVTLSEFTNSADYYNGLYYAVSSTSGMFGTIDPENNYQYTQIATGNTSGSIAYNPVDGQFYGLVLGSNAVLNTINPETGAETQVVAVASANFLLGLTITNDGRFLVIDTEIDGISELNPTTGELTTIVTAGFTVNYGQDLAMDRENNVPYWAAYNATTSAGQVYSINLDEGTITLVGTLPDQCSCFAIATEAVTGWLEADVTSGTIAAGQTATVKLAMDGSYAESGTFDATVAITTSNPSVGNSNVEVEFTITEPDCAAPTALSANVQTYNDIVLTWTAPSDLSGFESYSIFDGTSAVVVASDITATTYTFSDMEPGEYCFVVRAVYSNGCISYGTDEVCATALVEMGTVAGTVTCGELALEGATVTFGTLQATTNASGAYTIEVPTGTYDAVAAADGYISGTQNITVAMGNNTLDFDLELGICDIVISNVVASISGSAVTVSWEEGAAGATVELEAHDVWGDGSGYQMLLDANADAYGVYIPTSGSMVDYSADAYAQFEYKIPENADGDLSTANMIHDGVGSVIVPAGTYDYVITNPTPGDQMWIAADQCDPSRGDDFVIEAGNTYHFSLAMQGQNDCVTLTVTPSKAKAAASYNVYRNGTLVGENVTATTFTDNLPADASGEYCYTVSAICTNGVEGEQSEDGENNCVNTTGIESVIANSLVVYPNPTSSVLNISADGKFTNYEVVNLLGQVVISSEVSNSTFQVNTTSLNSGVYFIRLSGEGFTVTKKFVVE